ncbi:MAG: hypothetical protein WD716_10895 [Fimbriimonadaceae bacterium]
MARYFAFALLILAAAVCPAQRSMTGATSRLMLVMSPDVKKEIKVTKAQDKQIQEAMKVLQQEMQAGTRPIDLSDPMGSMDVDLTPILDDAQRARLEELYLQANTGYALSDPKVAAALELTDDQKQKVKTSKTEAAKQLLTLLSEARSASAMKAAKKKQEELGVAMLDVLTAEQRAKFEALKGKEFKFKG